jgi:hypothetical protein
MKRVHSHFVLHMLFFTGSANSVIGLLLGIGVVGDVMCCIFDMLTTVDHVVIFMVLRYVGFVDVSLFVMITV